MKRMFSLLLFVPFAALMLGATTPPTAGQRTAQCGYGQWVANDNDRSGVVVPVFTSACLWEYKEPPPGALMYRCDIAIREYGCQCPVRPDWGAPFGGFENGVFALERESALGVQHPSEIMDYCIRFAIYRDMPFLSEQTHAVGVDCFGGTVYDGTLPPEVIAPDEDI